ncbi:hypothetical protein B5P44_01270 [Mycobacterium sp. CBMA 213]|uniref:hypothetical protein n=1 Tax=unclassified Mycolicibacterium TaxID=2636767 RepID=UPI0012DC64B2|nr:MULTISPECIES: hypothetical protein [unclassified Mycolicibacterium]MUL61214.1 hypothetical protein [Mycolicibacterium sp. CBMA 335]MUM03451.1 hypothetical protein [Mycolicibacterium sp. CBMA 213]
MAAAVAALVVVLGVSSIVMFETLSNRQSHMTEAGPAGTPAALHRALAYAANTPPAQLIPAAQGEEPRRDWQLDGQRFEMVFGKPWLVTQVGFRPLELVPGRRVTKLRWELNDPDRTVFLQDADAAAGGNVIWTLYLGEGSYRTTGITATVLDTVPAPDASPSASPADRSPLVAYGNRNGEPTDTPNSGFGHPAAVNRDDYPWVAQHESSGALTVLFRRPISLTSIVFTPKGGA